METMEISIVDWEACLYRCRFGEFGEFPSALPRGPLPAVVAFSHWINDPRVKRRRVDETEYADIEHDGRIWTYRLARAYVSEFGSSGGRFQLLEPFDVGFLPD